MAEYIWVDGQKPTAALRSKTKILSGAVYRVEDIPEWGFDGSSTEQAIGKDSDRLLKPVAFVKDPIRKQENVLVMCEVMYPDGTPHESNTRAHLREIAAMHADQEPWFGIEQEYTLFESATRPLGWPEYGFPAPQGRYYCGVGAENVFGRLVVEEHMEACLEAGITLAGINAEVMPGQWEFQIGPLSPLDASDQLWLARWLLHRIAEDNGVVVTLAPKPVHGDWNGAGAHTNFSTKATRHNPDGMQAVVAACEKLGKRHKEHIEVYGAENEKRLTGLHETCSIMEFRYGVSDRGASIRIPMATNKAGHGYLEDRRPAANMDPYQVTAALVKTVCGNW